MKLLVLLVTFLASVSTLAWPLDERGTTEVWTTVTVTVTNGIPPKTTEPATTPTNSKSHGQGSGSNGQSGGSKNSDNTSFNYVKSMLDAHNSHRYNHSAPGLTWSDELASVAQQIGQSCTYTHNTKPGGGGYGQNIGAGAAPEDGPAMITNLMYNGELGLYPGYGGEPAMENFEKWGHFSQIVWKGTQQVGCATVHCPGGLANTGQHVLPYFLVCNFKPSGNVQGEFHTNVLKPQGRPAIIL